jgi:deazaflavin-dependent oxidoreductase (nitroreductase family)
MSFDLPPRGSRGTRMPGGSFLRVGARMMAGLYRRTGGRANPNALILTTIGAKSGQERTASVRRFADGEGRWLVVGSFGGSAKNPAWLINLASHPDKVWVEVGRDRFKVTPELLHGEERAAAWKRVVREAPEFGPYEHKTDREIPVLRLTQAS